MASNAWLIHPSPAFAPVAPGDDTQLTLECLKLVTKVGMTASTVASSALWKALHKADERAR